MITDSKSGGGLSSNVHIVLTGESTTRFAHGCPRPTSPSWLKHVKDHVRAWRRVRPNSGMTDPSSSWLLLQYYFTSHSFIPFCGN